MKSFLGVGLWTSTGRCSLFLRANCRDGCLAAASKLTSVVLLGILVSVAAVGCAHYTVERLPGSNLSRIVSPQDHVVCIGRWSSDGPEGPWDFYESNGNQTAAISFSRGVADGPLRFYWSSLVVPSAAGKLQVTGTVRDGRLNNAGSGTPRTAR